MKKLLLATACIMGLASSQQASAIAYTLTSAEALLIGDNTVSDFYNVFPSGLEEGSAASLYSSTFGGNSTEGFWVKISFDDNPQPVLESAFLKASNSYLWWDESDLAAFNSSTFDSIILSNSGTNGIKNNNGKYQGTSHAGLNGVIGAEKPVPDSGTTAAMLGLSLLGLRFMLRRKA